MSEKVDITGILNITVVKADNVKSFDFFGGSNPYVIVDSGFAAPQQTFVASVNKQKSAIWNEKLAFSVPSSTEFRKLYISVFDKDTFSKDDVMFKESLDISGYKLDTESLDISTIENENATLHLVIHYIPMTVMQKMMEKLGNIAENMKEKLISQIMTLVTKTI